MFHTKLVFAAACALALPAGAAGNLFIVDDSGGPGVDFTNLQSVVNSAQSGDTLLVESGSYAGFTIDAKALAVTADSGAAVLVTSRVTIRNIAAAQAALLAGIEIDPPADRALELADDAGVVWIESCTLEGDGAPGQGLGQALLANNCAAVVIADSTLSSDSSGGNHALEAHGSSVHVWESALSGGTVQQTVQGKDGAYVDGGFLYASDTSFQGGVGGAGVFNQQVGFCTDGSAGGRGLYLQAAASGNVLASTFQGGPGGPAGGPGCFQGPTGAATQTASGATLTMLAGSAVRFEAASPIRSGVSTNLLFSGPPDQLVWVGVSLAPAAVYAPAQLGTLCLLEPITWTYLGGIGPSGTKTVPVTLTLDAGLEVLNIMEQGLYYSLSAGFRLATPQWVTLVPATI